MSGDNVSGGCAPQVGPELEEPAESPLDEDLRRELLDMLEADQADMISSGNAERTDRLRQIVEEHGGPTFELVGRDGATAAWVIAQHSDFDVGFQVEMLALMRDALDAGQADPTEVAYLEDRVAVNRREPQCYGTQLRCGDTGPEPATTLVVPERVDDLRAEVGLEPLADYYEEFAAGCGTG